MGKRGPAPKPTYQRIMEGNPSGRPLPLNEPQPKRITSLPPAPALLEGPGLDMWHEMGEKLIRDGVLADTHLFALEMMCDAWYRIQTLRDDVQANGHTQVIEKYGEDGELRSRYERARPQVNQLKDAIAEFKRWCSEFGVTPSSASRVQVLPDAKKGEKVDPARKLLEELSGSPTTGERTN